MENKAGTNQNGQTPEAAAGISGTKHQATAVMEVGQCYLKLKKRTGKNVQYLKMKDGMTDGVQAL